MDKNDLYTLRWHLKNWTSDSHAKALRVVNRLLGESAAVDREHSPSSNNSSSKRSNQRSLWYSQAETKFPSSKTRGRYPSGGPEGAIVHWTAGRENQSLKSALSYQARQGFTYFVIDEDGNVGQNFPLNQWGYHAGKSYYDGLGSYVSNRVVGIEVICPGHLDKRRTAWFDRTEPYPEDKCRLEVRRNKNIAPGYYYKFTNKQENSLIKLLLWLWDQYDCFQVPYILGHDEVSPGRKVDPGGSLSYTMPEFRSKISKLVNETLQ
jgi:N-acetyl-anhydromuramyl-L-alanine amidase AmpD